MMESESCLIVELLMDSSFMCFEPANNLNEFRLFEMAISPTGRSLFHAWSHGLCLPDGMQSILDLWVYIIH